MKLSFPSSVPGFAAALCLFAATCAAPLRAVDLKVDINDRDLLSNTVANTEGGFSAMVMAATPANAQSGTTAATFGAQTVTITSSLPGTVTYDDRLRTAPVNNGTFDQSSMLQDFVFAIYTAANPTAGLDIEVAGLTAGSVYQITLWSFDASSGGTRVSDWSANGVLMVDNYTFNGSLAPSTNDQQRINMTATADVSGKILIQGRRETTSVDGANAASHGVFLNGLWVRDVFVDGDNDGMDDTWESAHGLNPAWLDDFDDDPDLDLSTNLQEYQAQTDPLDSDSDDDTLLDGRERRTRIWVSTADTGTSPLKADTDKDGLSDALENPDLPWAGPAQPGTNPNLFDSDSDTFSDREEVTWPSHPRDPVSHPLAGATLMLDFDIATAVAQPGWSLMQPASGWTGTFGAQTVTVTPAGSTTLDSRDRTASAGLGTYTPMFRDFVFAAASDNNGDGLNVTVTGLMPLTVYPVALWSWDSGSAATPRNSTWLASDGDAPPVVKLPLYVMSNAALVPSGLLDRLIKFEALSNSSGQLVIQGRKEDGFTGSTINVFLNGLLIGPPLTPVRFTSVGPLAGTSFPLTWASDDFSWYRVQRSENLIDWQTIVSDVNGLAGTTTFTDTTVSLRKFYRVERVSP